jgi:hypothetical protein
MRICNDGHEGNWMKLEKRLWLVQVALVALILLAAPLPAFSQGCALCYTQAASAGARMIAALRSGILILIAPPMLMTVAVAIVAYRRRNHFTEDEANAPDGDIPHGGS